MFKLLSVLFIFILIGCSKNANFKSMPGIPQPKVVPTETFNITINKNINEGNISDLSFNVINCGLACSSIAKTFNAKSDIILQFTANTGYSITGWTGCDSVSNSNTTCFINNIQSHKIVTPIVSHQLTQVCTILNGSGQQTSSDNGISWSTCTVVTCDTNYTNIANTCVQTTQTRSCTIANGVGQETSINGGVVWGTCTLISCDPNFHQNGNSCVADVITYQPSYSAYGGCSASQACDGVGTQSRTITDCSKYINGTLDSSVALSNCSSFNNYSFLDQSCNSPSGNKIVAVSNGSKTVSCPLGSTTQTFVSLACDANYTNVSNICVQTVQTRACQVQPAHSSGGTETSNDGGVNWLNCASYTCDTHYTNVAGTGICTLDTFTINVTKLISTGSVSESSFGKISCDSNCSSETQSYDYNSMIVLTVTPDSGYAVTGWTGCDSVSVDNVNCTISAISANRTVTPILSATYQTLSIDYSNVDFASIANYSVTKNGSNCTGACLTTLVIGDAIVVTITPSSFLNNVSSFSKVGTISNENILTTNEISFNMSSDNVTITANMTDKDIIISNDNFAYVSLTSVNNDISYLAGTESSLSHYVWFTASTPFRFVFQVSNSYTTNDRSIVVYSDNTCTTQISEISTVGLNYAYFNFTNTTDGSNTYYYKVKNVTKTSNCYKFTANHQSSITKTTETFVSNSAIESSSGYPSFLVDTSNTLSGNCVNWNSLGNPGQFTYNYGLAQFRSDGITVVAKAFMNGDLINPIYTQSQNTSCGGAGTYSLTFSQNANFVTADVIKYYITLKNYFDSSYTETITVHKEFNSKSCLITNGTGSQSYQSNGTYGTCTVVSCDTNYTQSGNTCVQTVQTRACVTQPLHSTGGLETSNDGGATYGSCSGFSCNTNYTNIAGICTPNIIDTIKFGVNSSNSCAITTSNITKCSGRNWNGEIATGVSDAGSQILVNVSTSGVLASDYLTMISVGDGFTCGVTNTNKPVCWGWGWEGEIGNNSFSHAYVPTYVDTSGVLSGKTIKKIKTGYGQACVIAGTNGTSLNDKIYCWGYNDYGQLGNNSTTSSSVPVAVDTSGVLSGKIIKDIATGWSATCVIAGTTTDNLNDKIYCWGYNVEGQLGNNSTTDSLIPVAVDFTGVLSGKSAYQISSVGAHHFCIIADDFKGYCWGSGGDAELGYGGWSSSSVPVAINMSGELSGLYLKQLAVGFYSTCALATDNNVYCWGRGGSGQLGNSLATFSTTPTKIKMTGALSGQTISELTSGDLNFCVKSNTGNLYCWGQNGQGQFGVNNNSQYNEPVLMLGGYSF